MTIKERKARERDEKRRLILGAANQIMKNEGIEQVSVRKIAKMIEYSPTIVYHYFENKDDIINQLMRQGYMEILSTLIDQNDDLKEPIDQFKYNTKRYIEAALENRDEYMGVLLNSNPSILKHTSVLIEGASKDRETIKILRENVRKIIGPEKNVNEEILELNAQIIWSSMFGLIIRLIVEDVSDSQRERLINEYLDFTISNIVNRYKED